jgi:hypothetical protein
VAPIVEDVKAELNITAGIAPIVKPVNVNRVEVTLSNNVTVFEGKKDKEKDKKGDSFIKGSLAGPFKMFEKEEGRWVIGVLSNGSCSKCSSSFCNADSAEVAQCIWLIGVWFQLPTKC